MYKGHIEVATHPKKNGLCKLTWRAELPWKWPNFDDLYRKHGSYLQKERFPIPNIKSLLHHSKYTIRVSNGLGGELERQELALSFLAYSEWSEKIKIK